jgi:hypothetical protein
MVMKISDGWIFAVAIVAFFAGIGMGGKSAQNTACKTLAAESKTDNIWYQAHCNEED